MHFGYFTLVQNGVRNIGTFRSMLAGSIDIGYARAQVRVCVSNARCVATIHELRKNEANGL